MTVTKKYMTRVEAQAFHENFVEEQFALYELADSHDFDNRQKIRNILRYQVRGYCFELPPTCARWGKRCDDCPHLKCRENTLYDGEKWDYDFDPDIDRFSSLYDNLFSLTLVSHTGCLVASEVPPKVDTEQSLASLLTILTEQSKTSVF